MSRVLVAVAAASLWLAPARVDAGACAQVGLDAVLLSHPGDPIPVGGGILVGWGRVGVGLGIDVERGDDPALRKDWRLTIKKKQVRPTMKQLAPGLVVYTSKKLGKGTKAVLVGGNGKSLGKFVVGKKKRAFAAAAPAGKVEISSYSSPRSGTSWGAYVTFDGEVPADAVAVIVYEGDVALTWGNVKGLTGKTVNVYSTPGRCSINPPNMQNPSGGSMVQLAWVDAFGRVSARSADIKVVDTGATP